MKKIIAWIAVGLLGVVGLLACGGGGGGEGAGGSSYYADWWCEGPMCAEIMGAYSGINGPFASKAACEQWRQDQILTSVCTTNPGGVGSGAPTISGFTPTSGVPGATVTITGSNFPTSVTVTINGVTATVISSSSTRIEFTIPSMDGFIGPIEVATSTGTVTSSNSLTVLRQSSVYWSTYNDESVVGAVTNSIAKVGKDGGAVTNLTTSVHNEPAQLAVDSTNVYWTEATYYGQAYRVGINTGEVMSYWVTDSHRYPYGIAVDATHIYWVEQNPLDGHSAKVMRAPIKGGGTIVIAEDPSDLTCSGCPAKTFGIGVDATNVYWTEPGKVYKAVKTEIGRTPILLASGTGASVGAIAVDSTSVYWIDGVHIKKIMTSGGSGVTTLATGSSLAFSIAVDSTSVYWIDGAKIQKTGISGGGVTTLATGTSPSRLAVDSTSVFWIDGRYIMKVAINGGTPSSVAYSEAGPPHAIAVDMP
jgi:hypothetical protein